MEQCQVAKEPRASNDRTNSWRKAQVTLLDQEKGYWKDFLKTNLHSQPAAKFKEFVGKLFEKASQFETKGFTTEAVVKLAEMHREFLASHFNRVDVTQREKEKTDELREEMNLYEKEHGLKHPPIVSPPAPPPVPPPALTEQQSGEQPVERRPVKKARAGVPKSANHSVLLARHTGGDTTAYKANSDNGGVIPDHSKKKIGKAGDHGPPGGGLDVFNKMQMSHSEMLKDMLGALVPSAPAGGGNETAASATTRLDRQESVALSNSVPDGMTQQHFFVLKKRHKKLLAVITDYNKRGIDTAHLTNKLMQIDDEILGF